MTIRLASSLCLGMALALGGFACGGSKGPAQDAGIDATDYCGPETYSLTLPITIASLGSIDDGFDLDGVKSAGTTTPIANDAAGCYQLDAQTTGGVRNVDSRLTVANATTSALGLDLSQAITDAIARGDIKLRMVMDHWNGQLTQCLVDFELQMDTGSGYVAVARTRTSLTNGLTPVFSLGASVPLGLPLTITDPSFCTPGSYGASSVPAAPACTNAAFSCTTTLPLVLAGVKLRIHIVEDASVPSGFRLVTSAPSATVGNPSMLGGLLVFWDSSAGRPSCTDAPLTDANFDAALQKAACDLGLGARWASDICPAFADNLDLHDTAGTLNTCATGGSPTTSNANSISFAAYVGN